MFDIDRVSGLLQLFSHSDELLGWRIGTLQNPKMKPHCIDNLNLSLNEINAFLKAKGIRLFYSAESKSRRHSRRNRHSIEHKRASSAKLLQSRTVLLSL